ncbi:MAG: sigma-E factor negative regulatory protein [Gammaproteobacteria bacterium]|nr:sigma-E factor negative regulatory protein [Gammaproteobacteria bacterium]MBU1468943.1 sigma-E factor negative regulatory protein [Gammaproteobacteria bacterium]MBU2238633.1 sigma-E factor negative regulatory protein [Gammaproteobacteria bacterium]MBU2412431.1 sigma-E factor negative regulatory protein [Gammaproteobacteria bacterium]
MTALNGSFPKNDCSRENDSARENDSFNENDSSQVMLSSLSAMFDGEATEQDLDLLIDGDSAELSRQLEAYHLIQQALHKDSFVAVGLEDSLMLRIRAGIDVDASFPEEQSANNLLPFVLPSENKVARPVWRVALSSVAVAASVAFVVIFGGNELLTPDATAPNLVAEVRSSSTNMAVTPLAELDKDALQIDNVRLQHYLRQHAEQAAMTVGQGMIPMARVVSYPVKE